MAEIWARSALIGSVSRSPGLASPDSPDVLFDRSLDSAGERFKSVTSPSLTGAGFTGSGGPAAIPDAIDSDFGSTGLAGVYECPADPRLSCGARPTKSGARSGVSASSDSVSEHESERCRVCPRWGREAAAAGVEVAIAPLLPELLLLTGEASADDEVTD